MGDETLLERILNGDEEPKDLPLALLQSITNDFSQERKIGQGGFGAVYKIQKYHRVRVDLMIVYDPTKPKENCKSREDTNMPAEEVPEAKRRKIVESAFGKGKLGGSEKAEAASMAERIVGSLEDSLTESESTDGQSDQAGSSPHPISLQHLKDITDNFSEDRILGSGGFGVVYKGVLHGEIVAVKKLAQSTPKSHKQFKNEVDLLMTLEHPNIVRLVGYCYDTQELVMPFEEKMVVAHSTECLLCLECMPNGSLDKYISDASSGLDWHKRCKIIEGISFGLQYLHEEANDPIIHLDLKPANILLGENLVPKITDFGLSRLFDKKTMHTTVASGTLGYMALEYQQRGIITPMADIFSLGVIILEVITGHRDYPYDIRTHSEEFIELELQKWRNRLHKEPVYTSLEIHCQQIERYIQIGLICVNTEREKRPTMNKIIDMLQGLESMDWYIRNELSSQNIMEEQ